MTKTFTQNGKTYTSFPTGNFAHVKTLIGTITESDDLHYEINGRFLIERANIKTDRSILSVKQHMFPEHTKQLNDYYAKGHVFEFKRPVLLLDEEGYIYENGQDRTMEVYCSDSSKMEVVNGEWTVTK